MWFWGKSALCSVKANLPLLSTQMGAAPKELRCERGTKFWNKSVKMCSCGKEGISITVCRYRVGGWSRPRCSTCPDPVDSHRFLSGFPLEVRYFRLSLHCRSPILSAAPLRSSLPNTPTTTTTQLPSPLSQSGWSFPVTLVNLRQRVSWCIHTYNHPKIPVQRKNKKGFKCIHDIIVIEVLSSLLLL